MNTEVLNSWKEIAAYMGRGVRTVQRWEQELGLPVRRPRGKERSAVIALKPDLDLWLRQTPHAPGGSGVAPHRAELPRHTNLHSNTEKLLARTHLLVERSTRMRDMVNTTLAITTQLRNQQTELMRQRKDNSHKGAILVRQAIGKGSELFARGSSKRATS